MSTPSPALGPRLSTSASRGHGSDDGDEEAVMVEVSTRSAAALRERDPHDSDDRRAVVVTPLPKLQLFIAIFLQVAEPVTCTVIYPFVNDLIRELGITGGDEKKTGYYVGVVESIFYAAEALTVLHWGKASDIVGRKPILLGGMAGLAFSMFGFGMGSKYWMLLASRCAQGAFNGNIGVTKSVMAEITDDTNRPTAFAFLPVAWSVGSTVGPAIGGIFSRPAERWPEVFGKSGFWHKFPYFLPCMVAAIMPILAFFLGLIGLKETNPAILQKRRRLSRFRSTPSSSRDTSPHSTAESSRLLSSSSSYGSTTSTLAPHPDSSACSPYSPCCAKDDAVSICELEEKPSFRSILIPQVLIPITNFMLFAFLEQCLLVLIPLVYSTPIAYGGLSMEPSQIGVILGVFGLVNGVLQILCFSPVRRGLGHRNTYVMGIAGLGAAFMMFPILERLVKMNGGKLGWMVWAGIVVQLACYSLAFMSYACLFLYVGAAAPTRASLGTTNGLAQLCASSVRAIAPTAASSLFALSLSLRNGDETFVGSRHGGYTVYVVLELVVLTALVWSQWLSKELKQGEN